MSIIITGATGHLGRKVIEALIRRGADPADIVAGGRNADRLRSLRTDLGVKAVHLDYDDSDSLDAAFKGATKALLVSGSNLGERVAQHQRVIDAARKAGIGLLAYTSVLHADESSLAVAPDHRKTEKSLRESGLHYAILRNGWYSENFAGDVKQAAESGTIVSAAGTGRISSAAREDYAEAAAAVLLSDGGLVDSVIELAGDEAWTYDDLAQVAARLLGRPVSYRNVTSQELEKNLKAAGVPAPGVQWVVKLAQDISHDELLGPAGELSRIIGRPTTSLEKALRPYV